MGMKHTVTYMYIDSGFIPISQYPKFIMFIACGRTYVCDPLNWADMLSVCALPVRIAAGFVSWLMNQDLGGEGPKIRCGKPMETMGYVHHDLKKRCCRSQKNNLMTCGWWIKVIKKGLLHCALPKPRISILNIDMTFGDIKVAFSGAA